MDAEVTGRKCVGSIGGFQEYCYFVEKVGESCRIFDLETSVFYISN
jgi:hypothetical protein